MTDKKSVRSAWLKKSRDIPSESKWGKVAQKLRGLQIYRDAATIFATLDRSLHQARINCLVDGKNLIMPAPSIREGFYLLPSRSISFTDLPSAVTFKGLLKHGQLLKSLDIDKLFVMLLLTGSMAIDREGGRVGDGNGFFDLCCALLQEYKGLHPNWAAMTFVQEEQIFPKPLPQDPWDIQMGAAITQSSVHIFDQSPQKPSIFWDMLSKDRIKRIDPLWKLYHKKSK
ncbi:MAG: 5-formyltetrahydrofolate cyclo-ligase [Desulfobulbales bacterium]